MKKRVVITGIGPFTTHGTNPDQLFRNLCNSETKQKLIKPLEFLNYKFKTKYYIPLPDTDLSHYNIDPTHNIIMDDIPRMTLISAVNAILDAGFTLEHENKHYSIKGDFSNPAIIYGIGISNLHSSFKSNAAHIGYEDKYGLYGNNKYDRFVVPKMMPNSAAAWVAIMLKLTGQSFTINASCASGTVAIGEAYRKIADGYNDIAITGGVESLRDPTLSIMRGFDTLSALTKSENGNPTPFSHNRSGFLFSEGGAATLILEEYQHALKRDARIYAEISGFESNNDNSNIVQPDKSGINIISLINKLKNSKKIDYLNAHGTGTELNDAVESIVIKTAFGNKDKQPLINSTKSIMGHTIGASGAIEAAVTALSIYNNMVHPNLSENNFDELNLINKTTEFNINNAISTSYGFGGHNAGLLFSSVKEIR